MNRRDFLKLLTASSAAYTIDWERLLWVPEKTIFIPSHKIIQPSGIQLIHLNEVLKKAFIYDSKLGYRYLKDNALFDELIKQYPPGSLRLVPHPVKGIKLTDLDED
jgi:hypothetical protein